MVLAAISGRKPGMGGLVVDTLDWEVTSGVLVVFWGGDRVQSAPGPGFLSVGGALGIKGTCTLMLVLVH